MFHLTVAWLIEALIEPAVLGDKDQCKVIPGTIGGTEYAELAVGITMLVGPEIGPGDGGAPPETVGLTWALILKQN